MSGGTYDYTYHQIEELAEQIRREPQKQYEFAQKIGDDVDNTIHSHISERMLVVDVLKDIAKVCHDVEWIDSADYGEEKWSLVRERLIQIRDRLNNTEVLKKETQRIVWKKEDGNWYPVQ